MHATTDPYDTVYDLPMDLIRRHLTEATTTPPSTIEQLSRQYAQALREGDHDAIANLITDDFISLSRERLSTQSEMVKQLPNIEFTLEEISIQGDSATAWGRTVQTETEGTFLWVLRRENGFWKLARESR